MQRIKSRGLEKLFEMGYNGLMVIKYFDHALVYILKPFIFYTFIASISLFFLSTHYQYTLAQALPWICLGMLLWTFLEYTIHRYFLHIEIKSPHLRRYLAGFHSRHHHETSDPAIFVAKIHSSIVTTIILFCVFTGLSIGFFGNMSVSLALLPGVIFGYLFYEWVHFSSHRYKPRTPYARWYRKNHLRHHFENDQKNFGVTSPIWDLIFSTYR